MLSRLCRASAIRSLPRKVFPFLQLGKKWHAQHVSSGTIDDKLALDLELSKLAREKAEADAAAQKAKAEAKAKAGANAAKAEAERGEAKAKAEVEVGAAKAKLISPWIPWISAAVIVSILIVDYIVHESTDFIKLRMRITMRKCIPPQPPPPQPSIMLSSPQDPLTLGFLPISLLGPTGCGKSTLLGSIASSLPTPAPVVLVRMRLPSTQLSAVNEVPVTGITLMDAAAKQVFSQIGFPLRRSFLAGILSHGFTLKGEHTQAELNPESRDRLLAAMQLLFEVSEELKLERQKSMKPLDAAPVLLFDEVQDLIKDERLRRAGGQLVFDMLGAQIVAYCVDRQAVRAVITGSSAEVQFEFAGRTPLRGNRLSYFDLKDPETGTVIAALQSEGGYSKEEARSMTDLCGTRLRLLHGPLTKGKKGINASNFLSQASALGKSDYASVFLKLNASDGMLLAKLIDNIEACESGQGVATRIYKERLQTSLRQVDMSPILYVDRDHKLFFQSKLHKSTWAQVRNEYLNLGTYRQP